VFIDKMRDEWIKSILNGICVIALLHCLFILLQFCGVWIFVHPKVGLNVIATYFNEIVIVADPFTLIGKRADTFTGLLDNTNMTSSLLLLGMPAFFRKRWALGLIPVIVCLLLARSLGGLIPAVVVIGVFLIYKLKRKGIDKAILAVSFIVIAFGIYLCSTENISTLLQGSGRLKAWWVCLSDPVMKRFIEGWGLGQYKVAYNVIATTFYKSTACPIVAHNEYIQVLFELGIIGLMLIVGFLTTVFTNVFKSKNEYKLLIALGLIAVVLNAGVNFLFHTTVAWLALIYLGLLQTKNKGEKDNVSKI